MSLDLAIQDALLAALNSPEGQRALRRALEAKAANGDDDQAYTVAQVAELSGFAADTIVGHITGGRLPAFKPRGCREWRIRRQDYRAWLMASADEHDEADLEPDEVARKMLARVP